MKSFAHRSLLIIRSAIVVSLASACFAQSAAETEANNLLAVSNWRAAEAAFSKVVASEPKNAAAWIGLGEAQLQQKEFAPAERSFTQSLDLRFRPLLNQMNLARVAAAQGNKAKAFAQFRAVIEKGQGPRARNFLSYSEFDRIRDDPEFKKIVAEEMVPCRAAHYHDFNFWVGEWKVYDPQEKQQLGASSVTREQEGCLIRENWKSDRGYESGTSMNFFDFHDSTWHQNYIDNSGDARAYPPLIGGLVSGKMTLLSELKDGIQTRWTWYELSPGKVRQMAEQTADSGKTWNISWDSVYVKQQ